MFQLVQQVLAQGDAKAEFNRQPTLTGAQNDINFRSVMDLMAIHVFLRYAYCDQKRYMQRHLNKSLDMLVRMFTARLT